MVAETRRRPAVWFNRAGVADGMHMSTHAGALRQARSRSLIATRASTPTIRLYFFGDRVLGDLAERMLGSCWAMIVSDRL